MPIFVLHDDGSISMIRNWPRSPAEHDPNNEARAQVLAETYTNSIYFFAEIV